VDTARNVLTPFAVHGMQGNAPENGSVNDSKIIADGTERQRIQQSQMENPLPGQKMDTIARQGRDLVATRPDDEERMGSEVSFSMDPIKIPPGRRGIDHASHSDDEASWEWINKSEHTDQQLPLLYRRQQTPRDDLQGKSAPTSPRVSESNVEGYPAHRTQG